MVAIDIFTGKKLEEICPSTHNMMVPNVNRNEYLLIDISDDGFLSLLLPDGSTKEDLKLPSGDLGEQIQKGFDEGKELMVCVLSAMGQEEAKSFKEAN
jgi:translation initiation factor 5A